MHINEFHNAETNVTGVVFKSTHKAGGFGVALRDDDSGLYLSTTFHGYQDIEIANAKARELAAV